METNETTKRPYIRKTLTERIAITRARIERLEKKLPTKLALIEKLRRRLADLESHVVTATSQEVTP